MQSDYKNQMSLSEFVDGCGKIDCPKFLGGYTLRFLHQRRVKMASYQRIAAPDVSRYLAVGDGWPRHWVKGWIEQGFHKSDPLVALARQLSRPFVWSKIAQEIDLSPSQKVYYDWHLDADIGDGLTLIVYGSGTRNACVSMGFGRDKPAPDVYQMFELQCAVQIAHIRYCLLIDQRRKQSVQLSPRETEVLLWMARGKSTTVIADILQISKHSVDTLTRRIFEKLEVNDRTSAVVQAVGNGLLKVDQKGVR